MSNEISSRQLTELAGNIYSHLSRDVIKQGLDYNKKHRVKQIVFKNNVISSTVNGAKPYAIQIHLNDFTKSACSCQKKTFCKHIAATFFYIYSKLDSPEPGARKIESTAQKNSSSPKKITRVLKPEPAGPIEVWFDKFDRDYEQVRQYVKQYFKPFIDHEYYNHFYKVYDEYQKKVKVYCLNWPGESQYLYQTYATLFILTRLEDASQKYDKMRWEYYFIEGYEKDLMGKFPEDLHHDQCKKFKPLFQTALDIIRGRLFQKNKPLFDWLLIYRSMYLIFGHDFEWLQKETSYLEEIKRKAAKNNRHYYNAVIGLAHFKFLAGQRDEALILLQQLNSVRIDDLHYYLNFFYTAEKWDALYQWLAWLVNCIENNQDELEKIFNYCIAAAERSPDGEKFILILKSWLPQSLEHFAAFLLHARLHRDWAELRASYWTASDEEAIEEEARLVESREPAALIPIYHQWVVRIIEGKNRKSYQNAVKLLKKLRAIYKKQKKIRDWNTYIAKLAARYARMSAFQEELHKGSLIAHDRTNH
ncbi:MAG: hypothetical protein A4E53_02043 [Pelotomaculum sp. PtaB.Bin104]|nr:MAG: hypothetical protein A4E53_02043 [Pelotomaculum sp. PtaB.Bin104]